MGWVDRLFGRRPPAPPEGQVVLFTTTLGDQYQIGDKVHLGGTVYEVSQLEARTDAYHRSRRGVVLGPVAWTVYGVPLRSRARVRRPHRRRA